MTINMRKIFLFWGFVLFLSVIVSGRPNTKICRTRNGKFPKPGTSCKGYYVCKNYVPVEETCVDGEHFNANKGVCDWEDLYPCLEKPKDKECVRDNGLFLKPGTNCKKYYRCCNGKAKVEVCAGDLLFDPSREVCEWPDLYTCIEKPERKECPKRNGKFLKPGTNCLKYYECKNGEPEERRCSKDTLFNPVSESCEMMEKYTCIEKPERKECPERNGKFLKPGTNCMKYYVCTNGEPEERRCPKDTLFDSSTKNCEKTGKYTCTETPDKDKCPRRNGKFLKPGTNCKEYYKCSDGRLKSKRCENNMLFNPSSGKCESPKIYTCVESSTTEKVSSTVTPFATSTPPDDQNDKSSTDSPVSTSTAQKTTPSGKITYLTRDPDLERTSSMILETSTIINTQPTENEISTTASSETSTLEPTTRIETSTLEPTTRIETSTLQSTTRIKTSTVEPTTRIETSTLQPTTRIETSTLELTTRIETSTLQSTTRIKTSTVEPTTRIETSTLEPTTKTETLQPLTAETSTLQSTTRIKTSTEEPTTRIKTSTAEPTTRIETSTLEPTTKTETSSLQPTTAETSTSQPTSSEIPITFQETSPPKSSTYSTHHTIDKEDREGELTEPTVFETTVEKTDTSSTVEVTTPGKPYIWCPEPNGNYPHPTDKHKFVACSNNIPSIFDCPSNLVYKHRLKRCDYE